MPDPKLQIILAAKDITGAALTKFQGRIAAITKSVFSFKGALGSLVGAGGFGVLITKSLETADAIGKTADKLGISTTALQEYRYAAERSGVSTNTLDMALQRFTRRTAEAAQGKGELRAVLEQYNIQVRDAAGNTRRTEEVFRDLATVLQRTQDPAERLRIAFKAFDSEGAALVNMLRDGAGGLDAFAAKARDLGIILDDDLIRGSEKAKDAVDDLGKVIEVSFSKVVLENVESITAAVETLASAMSKVAKYAGLRSVTETYSQGLALANQGRIDFEKFKFADFTERQRLVDEALKSGLEIGPDGRATVRKKITGQPAPIPPGGYLPPPPAVAGAAGKKQKGGAVGRDFWQIQAEERFEVQSRMYDVLIAQEQEYNTEVARIGEVGRDFWQIQAEERFEVQSRGLDALIEAEQSGSEKLIELTERTADAMQQNFSSLFFDVMQGEFNSLSDYADGVLDSINRSIADFLSQQLVQGLFGDLTKAGGGGGLVNSLVGAIFGSAKGNVFSASGVKAFARGGVVQDPTLFGYAGGLGLMGERGAEAVMPLSRTRSGELGVRTSAAGGNQYHFHMTVQAPEGRLPRESINQLQATWASSMQRSRQRYG